MDDAKTNDLTRWLPFAELNLLRNPFGELSREDRITAAVVDTDRWVGRLEDSRYALQLLGDCGRGKSTHMLALSSRFSTSAYVYLPEDQPLPLIPQGNPLFIDEAQRLPWWKRSPAFRRRVPLVLGTHQDLRAPLERFGYHVETVQVASFTSPARVHRVLNRRIELARLGPGDLPEISAAMVATLMEEFGDDLRSMEDWLYEQFQVIVNKEHDEIWQDVI